MRWNLQMQFSPITNQIHGFLVETELTLTEPFGSMVTYSIL